MSNTIMMCDDIAAAISGRHSGTGVKSSLDKVKERVKKKEWFEKWPKLQFYHN